MFRAPLGRNLLNTNKKNNTGAKPHDVLPLFQIFILQRYFSLGDRHWSIQSSFKAFLSIYTGDKVLDEQTGWSLRESEKQKQG